MKKNVLRKMMAMLMLVCLLPCVTSASWAETGLVAVNGTNTAFGDITVEPPSGVAIGIEALSDAPSPATVAGVQGNISVTGQDDDTIGVRTTADASGAGASTTVTGNVTANSHASGDLGVVGVATFAEGNVNASTTVNGNVTATSSGDVGETTGIDVYSGDAPGNGTSSVTVKGNVSSIASGSKDNDNAVGVSATAYSGNSIAETGDVNANSRHGNATGIHASSAKEATEASVTSGNVTASANSGGANGIIATAETGEVKVTAGNVTAETSNTEVVQATGVQVAAHSDAASVTVIAGTVTADGYSAAGVESFDNEGTLKINTKDITATTTADYDAWALTIQDNDGQATVTVDGNIEANSGYDATGVDIVNSAGAVGGETKVTVNGDVTVGAPYDATGVFINAEGSDTEDTVTVNGNITSTSDNNAMGIDLNAENGGEAEVEVNGDVTSSQEGVRISVDGGEAKLAIKENENGEGGNVTGGTDGLVLTEVKGSDPEVDVAIEGTLAGEEIGVLVGSAVTEENLEIKVWKIETNEVDGEEHVVATKDNSGNLVTNANTEKIEQNIKYIIKVEPSQKDMIKLSGTTETDEGYQVANEGDTVTMKITVPEGYKVTGAYNGDGEKVPLKQDEDGNYYVDVPKGGGVYLSAEVKKEESKPEPHYFSSAGGGSDEGYIGIRTPLAYVTVTFDFNGGFDIRGLTGPVVKTVPAGTWVRLIDAPRKEGTCFVRWQPDDESITVTEPYKSFCAVSDVVFTAVWEGEPLPAMAQDLAVMNDLAAQFTMESVDLKPLSVGEPTTESDDVSIAAELTLGPDLADYSATGEAPVTETVETADLKETADEETEESAESTGEVSDPTKMPAPAPAAAEQSVEPAAPETVPVESASEPVQPGSEVVTHAISVSGLDSLTSEGISLPAKLVIDVGGQLLEIPVNIQITLG